MPKKPQTVTHVSEKSFNVFKVIHLLIADLKLSLGFFIIIIQKIMLFDFCGLLQNEFFWAFVLCVKPLISAGNIKMKI